MTATKIRAMTDLIQPHLRHIRAAGYAENTIVDRGTVLRRLDADLPLGIEEATVSELADWLARPDWSNQTKSTYYGHIAGFFSWACNGDDPYLDWNPAASLTRPKVPRTVPRPVTDEQLADLFERASEPYRCWMTLAAYAGLRAFEIAHIERKDITEQTITVRGKGGKNAAIPTHPAVWKAVKDLPAGRVARNASGRPVSHISTRFGEYLRERLGVEGVGLHRLRHWFGTTALATSHDLRVVQELLRHASPATTAIYTQITSEQRRTAIAALPTLTTTPAST